MTSEGLITIPSNFGPEETVNRLEKEIISQGINVFAHIDHAAGAGGVGMTLRPTTVILFGNPRGGTPFMQANQTIGIDLPLKALVWEDASGKTFLSYNDPAWLAKRHGITGLERATTTMSAALNTIATKSTK
jgi:uncharacterized protein (DUF302 family)